MLSTHAAEVNSNWKRAPYAIELLLSNTYIAFLILDRAVEAINLAPK